MGTGNGITGGVHTGYGYDLLVECTRFLADRGAEFIAAPPTGGTFRWRPRSPGPGIL